MVAWQIIVTLMIGGTIGFLTCAILTAGKLADQRMEDK